ncbi:hypothetical protein H072_1164 [Dactylellina haptotyla CBS 200.50]|uniref:Mediator of RNA polymerase II transcription subunit 19 n=1 Tax=Dactylellina haptotyla (strain CBS 200.50) TaxID=1284197 RepID=S8CB05_DACHA|nr:hypothetical protein H072_1164 [Dactylellina haptotyla CBS 200.50]
MQSVGTHQYNTSNSQQPHNHPTPQSPPGLYSASSGFNTSMNSNKVTSPRNNPQPPSNANSLPTPRSPTIDATQSSNMEDAMDVDRASSLKRRRSQGDLGDDERPRKSRSRSREPMEIDAGPSISSLTTTRPRRTVPTMEELLAMPMTGPPSWLNTKKHTPQRPDLTSNLIDTYGLSSIAASVARTDSTGQKQKLRKSYKGKIAGLSGKNEVVTTVQQMVVPEGQEGWGQPVPQLVKGGLLEMLDIPDEEWHNLKVLGKELPKGGSGGRQLDFNTLRKGLSNWSKGPIPDYDASWLALEDPPARSGNSVASGHPSSNPSALNNVKSNTPAASTSPNGVNTASPNAQNVRSSGRKRRREYGESGWEGYGDEFDDDGGSGYDDEEARKKKKKRKIPEYDDRVGGVGMNNMPVNHAHAVGVGGGYYQR